MRVKSSARRGTGRRRPPTTPSSTPLPSSSPSPSPSPSPAPPNLTQAGTSSIPEDEVIIVPDTYGDSPEKEKSRDQGHDVDAETVAPQVSSEGRYLPDESVDDQVVDKSSCLKCGEGEGLLVCSETSCPIAIHESCLNCKPRFDDFGSFYCPYCMLKRMKVKVEKLRRKVMLAEKEKSRDQGHDGDAEAVAPLVTSEGRYLPDESTDDQVVDKSSCLNCGEGEELLVCSETSCPIAIHERCLNCKPRFDDLGSFYCPYCTQKQMEVKVKKLRSKVMLAEKNLSNFLDPGKDEGGEKKLEGESPEAAGSHVRPCSRNDSKYENKKKVDNDGMFQSSNPVNQLHENSTSSDDLSERHERKQHKSKPVLGPSVPSSQHVDSSCGLSDEASARNKTSEGAAGPPVIIPQVMPQPLRALSSWTLVKRDSPADQTNFQLRNPRNLTETTLPSAKRKRLYWRPEEEEMLKDAVRSFQSNVNKNLPWRKILEYGRLVFDETRTPSDLKDKWKNMTRSKR